MSFLDEVAAEVRSSGTVCSVKVLLEQMAPADAADLRTALSTPTYRTSVIARALHKRGAKIAEQTLTRHRRGGCNCGAD